MRRLFSVLALVAVLLALGGGVWAATGPEIYDISGAPHDVAWAQARYGHVGFSQVTGAHFALRRVDCTLGPATIVVRVLDAQGRPAYNQPVALSWPGITYDPIHPDPNIKPIDAAYRTRLMPYGITQKTDTNGYTGFGISQDWYIGDNNGFTGPGIVWILSPSITSDGMTGVGMLPFTEHEGPLSLTFQEVADVPTATQTSAPTLTPIPATATATRTATATATTAPTLTTGPPSATPTRSATPAPSATPLPGNTDLVQAVDRLNVTQGRIATALETLVGFMRQILRVN